MGGCRPGPRQFRRTAGPELFLRSPFARFGVRVKTGRLFGPLVSLFLVFVSLLGAGNHPVELGTRRELMLDDTLFETIRDLEFRQHSPRDAEKILDLDAPWEGRKYHGFTVCGYPVVLEDGGGFRLYYASYLGIRFEPRDPQTQFTCYAESNDGVTWNRVRLGRVEFEGTTDNNILLKGRASHNFAPFIDTRPGTPASERFKAVGGNPEAYVFASADGLEWRKLKEEPILDGEEPAFDRYGAIRWGMDPSRRRAILDSLNVSFWDPANRRYVLFFRAYLPCLSRDGKRRLPETRSVMRATSRDFLNWENIEPIEYGEPRREWRHSLYTSGLKPYHRAPHLILGFPLRTAPRKPFHGTSFGLSETAFMYSRDTRNFVLVDEPFLRPGRDPGNWSKHGNLMAWGMLQTAPDELSFYYLQHDHQPDTFIRRGVLRVDGFRSLHGGGYPGGTAITRPLVFQGTRLEINAATGAGGGIRIAILDAARKRPVPGYESSKEFYGDEIQHFVEFGEGGNLAPLSGKPIRLRFEMYEADLYSLKFH